MKTLKFLKSKTPKIVEVRSSLIKPRLQNENPRTISGDKGYVFGFRSRDPMLGSGRYHKQLIWFNSPKVTRNNYLSLEVKVFCSCEYFNYNLAYALNKYNSVIPRKSINYAIKTPSKVTNPRAIPHCCKHILAAIKIIGKRGGSKKIVSSLNYQISPEEQQFLYKNFL